MTLEDVINSKKKFSRPSWAGETVQYFEPGTGPFKDVVGCDYFALREKEDKTKFTLSPPLTLSTSLDLYAQDITAHDYFLIEEGG